ncbi:MAG: hypothetical protein M5U19_12900 [Microthrixaceae bacterium]|nr:hypothetical protein [Microthrixaceae bacterium]
MTALGSHGAVRCWPNASRGCAPSWSRPSSPARGAEAARTRLSGEVEASAGGLARAEAELERCEAAQRLAEADRSAWAARAEALSLALQDAHQRAGTDHLNDLNGVLGALVDLVEVDRGWEEAFEAAAADALGAVVVADIAAARSALASLVEGDHNGAVLALGTPVPGTDAARSPLGAEAARSPLGAEAAGRRLAPRRHGRCLAPRLCAAMCAVGPMSPTAPAWTGFWTGCWTGPWWCPGAGRMRRMCTSPTLIESW